MVERAHVVQPVGELDQHDPDVMRHRDDHLAEILRLLFCAAGKSDLRNLGHAVDQPGDFAAEQLLHLVERGAGVLDHVVQQAGDDRGQVELELRDDQRDVERMNDVGLARLALLLDHASAPSIRRRGGSAATVGLRIVRLNPPDELFELLGLAGATASSSTVAKPSRQPRHSQPLGVDDRPSSCADRIIDIVVDNQVVVLGVGLRFFARALQAARRSRPRLSVRASAQALFELGEAWRQDENRDCVVRILLANLARALDVDIEQDVVAGARWRRSSGARGVP